MVDLFDILDTPVARPDAPDSTPDGTERRSAPHPADHPTGAPLFDAECDEACRRRPSKLVSWWLMASFCYYILDDPILSDAMFDHVAKEIAEHWNGLDHPHKHMLGCPDNVNSGYHLAKSDYPSRVWHAICALRGQEWARSCRVAFRSR